MGTGESMDIERIKIKEKVGEGFLFIVRVGPFSTGTDVQPGQFFELRWTTGFDPFIPRPFSLFTREGDDLLFLVRKSGRFTESLLYSSPDRELLVFGPLGRGFPQKKALLVGGGTGIAPLFYFAERFPSLVEGMLVGFKTKPPDFLLAYFDRLEVSIKISTEDGSMGFMGNVYELFRDYVDKNWVDTVFLCGPHAMIEAFKGHFDEIEFFLSLESYMACGTGICLGCAVKRRDAEGYLRVCKEGPIFEAREIQIV